jgi:hypothetical protein
MYCMYIHVEEGFCSGLPQVTMVPSGRTETWMEDCNAGSEPGSWVHIVLLAAKGYLSLPFNIMKLTVESFPTSLA